MAIKTNQAHKNLTLNTDLPEQDLVILTGQNNSGKSAILQYLNMRSSFKDEADYISPRRFDSSNELSISTNQDEELKNEKNARKNYNSKAAEFQAPDPAREFMGLDDEHRSQAVAWHNKYFGKLKFEKTNPKNQYSPPKITIDERLITEQGSGSRAVLVILSRIFDPKIKTLLIDEPEIGVEPRVQKHIFTLLKKVAQGADGLPKKRIYLATHSHLFLDKEEHTNNFIVSKDSNGNAQVRQVVSKEELHDLVFRLLGNSPDDLFFPKNIVVVEGVSDSIFLTKVLELRGCHGISVHFADGETKVMDAVEGIDQMLKSTVYAPLYRKRLCILVDKQVKQGRVDNWKKFLIEEPEKRILVLPKGGIEYYYPPTVMKTLSGLEGGALERGIDSFIDLVRKTRKAASLGTFTGTKRDLANCVTSLLTVNNLVEVDPTILALLDEAAERSDFAESDTVESVGNCEVTIVETDQPPEVQSS